jgi:hypothetical protein
MGGVRGVTGVTSVAGTSTELRTVHKKALFLVIPRKNQKERQKSFADIERTLAKLAKLLSHRWNAREPSKSSMERSRTFEVIDGMLAKLRSQRRMHLNHDDIAIVKKTVKSDRDVIVIVFSRSNLRHHE